MRKYVLLAAMLAVMFMMTGCYFGATSMPPSGATPGAVFSSVKYPSMQNASTNYNFDRKDFKILGKIKIKTMSVNIAGLFAFGNNGYGKLMEEAKIEYPGADALINVYYDTNYTNVCLTLFTKVTSTVTATVVKNK